MTKKYFFSCVLLCLLFCARGQDIKVSGVVADAKNEPLAGASVKIKGTDRGVSTNEKGFFTISAPANATLEVSSIGYVAQSVKVAGQSTLSIKLAESNSNLTETVVIGYQKITRKMSTAAISSISGKELANLPSSSFDQLLQGRLSGVNVQNFSGQPGTSPTVSVRGSSLVSRDFDNEGYQVINQPLYVVDGVPQPTETYASPNTGTGTNYLAGINPNDIESVDVLKDASAAAIYGSRAANGVILITTKRGRSGAPRVTFVGFAGITQRPELREVTLGATERRQKMEILQRQLEPGALRNLPKLLTDSLNPAFNGNTDWQDMFYQTGIIKSADLSLSGGAEGMNYRFSTSYFDEEGIVKATGFKRYATRLNINAKTLNGKLDINPIIYYARTDRARGNGSNSSPIALSAGNMPSSLFALDDSKKEFLLGQYDKNMDKNVGSMFSFNLNLTYEINKHLKLNSQSSYMLNSQRRDYNRTNALENNNGNYSYAYSSSNVNLLTSNYISYVQSFSKHNLSMVVGSDVQFNENQSQQASGWNGVSDQIQVVQGFKQDRMEASSDYQAFGLLSFYGRLAYDFDGKYLLSASARGDGSSRFGTNNKWGFFPAASVGWILSEENFLKASNIPFSLVKIRGSLGTSGSLPGSNYLQYSLYNVNAGEFAGTPGATSYNGQTAVTPNYSNGVAQKNLSWEKSMQWNIGTDLEVMGGKYAASFDVYNKESSLQLFSVILPVTTGYDQAMTNSIGVRNSGVELTLIANPLPSKKLLKWTSSLNISYNRNRIMSLPNGGRDLPMNGDRFDKAHILSVGRPINSFYLYKTMGVFPTDDDVPGNRFTGDRLSGNGAYLGGEFYLADLDGDSRIDIYNDWVNPDKLPVGDPNPKFTGGWTNNFTWKNFNLSIFCTFTFNRDVLNLYESDIFNTSSFAGPSEFAFYSTPDFSKIDIWKKPGDKATYAKYDIGTWRAYYTSAQTFFLEKGGYFRVKSVNMGYNLPSNSLRSIGISRLRLFGTIDNLLMIQQSSKLPDAEAVSPYGEYNGGGYPIPKKFTLGFEVNF
ncbi:SusC/RagA family TonB-linked outer membrane protein [Paraflavitalea sp. CAU 1676]|uniref:SusC/RagA family TonB-linked outer membrane protein n=1 Tax=Paraflavitalea sp. CAU 1676 TaxID=3032598 RepID=UPI0023DAF341|nr:SusC/RagA family TonB-linked outer membrane protein [Paraflavitalea sp. CAU 1676]MDF2189171.1 SusC/RagA family TonB-linked outer membrane protein [Paraflavitalea sp. CAU 1676]